MSIKLFLAIKRFKKGKKKRKDYESPQATYTGTVTIPETEKIVSATLGGAKGTLPVNMRWDSNGEISCVATTEEGKIRFLLTTRLSSGEDISSFNAGGWRMDTGKFTNWSASIIVRERT